jgi:surface antigen
MVGGCSLTYRLDSFWTKSESEVAQTASIRPSAVGTGPTGTGVAGTGAAGGSAVLPPENDLVVARLAVIEALNTGGKDTSTPWENPRTGARGTITPIASAYHQEGNTCQDFLASYVLDGSEAWLQGEACRASKGRWEVRRMRPWRRN